MANYTIQKRVLLRGEKGDTGDTGTDTTVPQAGIIAYKGDTVPEGYILYSEVPDGVLTHITATYTQTATITDASSLDELRPDLVVKAYYYDDETGITTDIIVTDYTLSGTLEVGTSTITASYKGFSDSFDVTVEESIHYLYNWDFTQSLTDSVQGKAALLRGANSSGITRDNSGIHINGASQCIYLDYMDMTGYTLEIDVDIFDFRGDASSDTIIVSHSSNYNNDYYGIYGLYYVNGTGWCGYGYGSKNAYSSDRGRAIYNTSLGREAINGKTIKIIYGENGGTTLYYNDELIGTSNKWYNIATNHSAGYLYIGGKQGGTGATFNGNSYNMTITGVRIYANQ